MIYNYMDDNMPDWAKPEVQRLMDTGILCGTGAGLNLNDDRLWMCVILGRMIERLETRE